MERVGKKNIIQRIKARIDDKDINVSLIATSIVVNTITALFKVFFGVYLWNLWLIMHAVYFVIMALVRYRAMKQYIYCKTMINPITRYNFEFDIHNKTGKFNFLIGFSYLALCVRMLTVGDVVLIGGFMVYWFITFTVIKIVFAVYGLVITRHKEDPIIRVMKVIGTIDACVSVVPTLYTSLSFFSFESAAEISATLGILISICVMISGIIMANRSKGWYYAELVSAMEKE